MGNLAIEWYPSPNFDDRPQGSVVDSIILHHTALPSAASALMVLTDPYNNNNPVSSHYLIGKNGKIFQLVKDEFKAWHAGVSYWKGRFGLNNYSIGIELDNTGEEPFARPLMESLILLMHHLINKYQISRWNILAHGDIAPGRKVDPSHYFDWKRLSDNGISYFPNSSGSQEIIFKHGAQSIEFMLLQKNLYKLGYKIDSTGRFDAQSLSVIRAFNRRYCPKTFECNFQDFWTGDADLKLNELIRGQQR